jgi:hypothetical protein
MLRKQLVKESEINAVRHNRSVRTKENRMRAKIALSAVAYKYKQVKLQFVSGSISKETMAKAHGFAARQVATIREQFGIR